MTVLHDTWLVESADSEPWIWRADCKVIHRYSTVQDVKCPYVVQEPTVNRSAIPVKIPIHIFSEIKQKS